MKRWEELLDGLRWQAYPGRFRAPAPGLLVTGIAHDSRQVRQGDLFVAIHGAASDGNRFASQAEQAGAVAILTDTPENLPTLRIPVARVDDARLALSRIAARFFDHPARRLTMVGITGTLGKTSVTEMVAAILAQAGPAYEPGVIGSLGIRFRDQRRRSLLTTPDALTLQRTLAEMVAAGVKVVVMEVTSHAQLQRRVAGIDYSIACLLNLVPGEHADVHPNFEDYASVKLRILSQVLPQGVLLFNGDDPEVLHRVAPHVGQLPYRIAAYGKTGGAAERGLQQTPSAGLRLSSEPGEPERLRFASTGPLPTLKGERPAAQFEVPWALWGQQNRQNAAAAAAIALTLGVDVETIVSGLASARPARRRMELVFQGAFRVLDDTTGHPASFEALFRSLEPLPRAGIVLLTAVRGSRGETVNRENARTIARWAERLPVRSVVVTASSEAVHPKDAVHPQEWQAFREELVQAGVRAEYRLELRQAVEATLEIVRPGEILVLAGAQGLDQAAPLLRSLLDEKAVQQGPS